LLYDSLVEWNTQLEIREQGNAYENQGGYDESGLPSGGQDNFPLGMM
jgi:hypothetical protein